MKNFTIFPAIDLQNGKCVRLMQGRAQDSVVYGDDPVEMAKKWEQLGGKALHVVDLDGAFKGTPMHAEIVKKITSAISIPVEIGGGLRTDESVKTMLDAGVARVILGTRALEDEKSLSNLVERFGGDKIVVGIDAKDGLVQVKGWVETSETLATDLAKRVADLGVKTIIYTDTATDGMLKGPNLRAMDAICSSTTASVVASGGVSTVKNVLDLLSLGHDNLEGAIVGKALYEERVTIKELQEAIDAFNR